MKTSTIALPLPLAILAATSPVAFSAPEEQDKQGLRHLDKGKDKICLKAKMRTSNNYEGKVKGTVKVCFNNPLGDDTGSFTMKVHGLPALIAGGVHIHSGTDCTDAGLQGGHYWDTNIVDDPWFNNATSLAPTGTGYSTDEDGEGVAYFFFNNGFGYDDNKGHAVVIHGEVKPPLGNGAYPRIACGILQ